ncbi:MAG: TPR end-of-group domain-containing protein [Bacteroidia bacterium]
MKQFFLIIILLVSGCNSYGQTPPKKYFRLIEKAKHLYAIGDYKNSALTYSFAFQTNNWKGTTEHWYNAACSWALAAVPDSAFFQLYKIANKAGYSDYEEITANTDFLSLRNDKRWNSLIEKIKYNKDLAQLLVAKSDTLSALDILLREAKAKSDQYDLDHPTVRNHLTFSVNLIQLPINELGIYIDYYFSKRHSIGFNIASIYANSIFHVNIFSGDQGTYPGAVWNGVVGRINYKNYFSENKRSYICFQILYKTLSYRNQTFINAQGDNANTFTRSEDAFLCGLDCMYGYHVGRPSFKFNLELFFGGGLRYRERNYTTLSSDASYYSSPEKLGAFHVSQMYPTIVIGLKVGFKTFVGKKTK